MHKPMKDEALYSKSEITWTEGKKGKKTRLYIQLQLTLSIISPQAERPIGENRNVTGFDVQP